MVVSFPSQATTHLPSPGHRQGLVLCIPPLPLDLGLAPPAQARKGSLARLHKLLRTAMRKGLEGSRVAMLWSGLLPVPPSQTRTHGRGRR